MASFPGMTIPPKVWLRGPVDGVRPLLQPAAHAILQVGEDVLPIVADLTPGQLWVRPGGATRPVGRKQLPSTRLGLILHAAEHSSRHAGQIVTLNRVVRGSSTE
jgi:hypothetical protein